MIDHVVFAGSDLGRAATRITQLLGVMPTPGGSHVGKGTRNELLSLGGTTYLEVIGPDPDQPEPAEPRPFGVDRRVEPALVAWCARPLRPLADVVTEARAHGIEFGGVSSMSRQRPDGLLLRWTLTAAQLDGPLGCALPFLIDWGDSPHPAEALPAAARLLDLEIHTPQVPAISTALDIIGITSGCSVRHGERPSLTAHIAIEGGEVTLSG